MPLTPLLTTTVGWRGLKQQHLDLADPEQEEKPLTEEEEDPARSFCSITPPP
jgi:hypothetical protein